MLDRSDALLLAVAMGTSKATADANLTAAGFPAAVVAAPKPTDVVGVVQTVMPSGQVIKMQIMGDGSMVAAP